MKKKQKQNRYEQALSRRVNAAIELNKLCDVFILMRAPYMSPNGFPQEMVPVSDVMAKVAAEWSIVLRESKNG